MFSEDSAPFRFNFGGDAPAEEAGSPEPPPPATADAPMIDLGVDQLDLDECGHCETEEQRLPCSSIKRVRPCAVHGTAPGAPSNSDLVPRVYEGGFKLWECATDLAGFVEETAASWKGLRVAELGCGHGIPGLVALRHGAACVHFQDYNAEVLARVTARNCALACGGREALRSAVAAGVLRFLAGGWASAAERLGPAGEGQQYDVILTSETIYSREGTLVAAKRHYFGVGGGVLAFEALVERDGRLTCGRLKVYEDGSSQTRDLLRLVWR
eukprot:tig00000254_g22583.t1